MARSPRSALIETLARRASIPQRFALIALVALAPLALLSAVLWREVSGDLHRLQMERAGVAYARTIWRVLHANGRTGVIDDMRVDALATAADRYDDLFRSGEMSAKLRRLISAHATSEAISEAALGLMKRVGDRSNLFLDDNSSSYFYMQLTIGDLPETAAAIAAGNALLDRSSPASAAPGLVFGRVKFALDHVERDALDALIATRNRVARERMSRVLARLHDDNASYELIGRTWFKERQQALLEGRSGFVPTTSPLLRLQHARAVETAQMLWSIAGQELMRALAEREQARQNAALGAALLLLAGIGLLAGLIWVVIQSIVRPWGALMDTTNAMSSGNVHTAIPCGDYANEIGDAARALEVFRVAIAERAVLAADLARERDALEERVMERTRELEQARTAAQESEQLLSQAMQSVHAGVWGYDTVTNLAWSSPQVAQICGRALRAEDLVDGIWNIIPEEQAQAMRAAPPDPLTGLHGLNMDVAIIHPDGGERWFHSTAVAMPDGRLVGLIMDVTARKRQELDLAEARRRAEDANAAKSRFIASMSHEIRTPLNGVLAMAAALRRTPLTAEQGRMLDVVTRSGDQLLAMLDDVLDIAKIEAGHVERRNDAFDLAPSVEAVAALYRESATEKALSLHVDVAVEARGVCTGDSLRLRQVLQNFVSNAVKFTEHGSVTLRVRRKGDNLRFEVEDTGIGVAETNARQLFLRFVQADTSITRRYGGTGLGLAICREFAELMGGAVGVTSVPGVGSTFWFEAPFAPVDAAQDLPRALTGPIRILAAEDNPGNRLVLDTLLAQAGLSADFVDDGAQAIEATRICAYDLVLMDLHMPHVGGVDAARAIRAGGGPNATVPIIALTANTQPESLKACRAAGMTGHVSKPIVPSALYDAIVAALRHEPPAETDLPLAHAQRPR